MVFDDDGLRPADFPALRDALAATMEHRRARLCAYADEAYGWPLNRYWCPEQVLLLAVVLARTHYWHRLDAFVAAALGQWLRNERARFNRQFGQARGMAVQLFGADSATVRAMHQENADAGLVPLERAYRKRHARRVCGRPPELVHELRRLFMVAGLSREQADAHGRELFRRVAAIYTVERQIFKSSGS